MPRTVSEIRFGAGQPSGYTDVPTFDIPADCMCTWTILRAAPGRACVSRLRYRNTLCRHRHEPAPDPAARWGTDE